MSSELEVLDPDRFALKRRSDGTFFFDLDLEIIPREEWGAQPPRDPGESLGEDIGVIVATLNTETPSCANANECMRTVRKIQKKQLEQGFSDVQYNFLIGCDGRVYEGRGWHRKSCPHLATPPGFPEGEERLDIAYIGDWRYLLNPTDEMLKPSLFLMMFGVRKNYVRDKYKFLELDKRYVKPALEPLPPDF